jgi:hypothetical protein
LLIALQLVFQQKVISGQHVLFIGTTDTMIREMSFVLLVPVELAVLFRWVIVYIKCTYKKTVFLYLSPALKRWKELYGRRLEAKGLVDCTRNGH